MEDLIVQLGVVTGESVKYAKCVIQIEKLPSRQINLRMYKSEIYL